MKHLVPIHHAHRSGVHYWSSEHAKFIAFIVASLVTAALMTALIIIRNYIEPTI
jgi:hypothetical protein